MWNKKPKFDEQEQEIIDLIELLANHKGTKVEVELDDLTFYLDQFQVQQFLLSKFFLVIHICL